MMPWGRIPRQPKCIPVADAFKPIAVDPFDEATVFEPRATAPFPDALAADPTASESKSPVAVLA